LGPEPSIVILRLSFARVAHWLAWETGSDYVNGWRGFVYVVNIVYAGNIWPMLGKDFLAIGILFTEPNGFEFARTLKT